MRATFFVIILFIFCSAPATVHACSCATGDPSSEFNRARAVFLGRVLGGTERLSLEDKKGKPYRLEAGAVRIRAEEVFKGDVSGIITVQVESMNGTSCGPYGLRRSERYVIYAYADKGDPKTLYTGVCTRTMTASSAHAKEDLEFLRNLPLPGTGGNLRGGVWADLRAGGTTPLSGVRVTITGADQPARGAITDARGEFDVKLLNPGTYRVTLELPPNYTTERASIEVTVEDRGTAGVGFELYMDGSVTGQAVDRQGRGFNSIFLKLGGDYKGINGHATGEDGGFEMKGVPPGEYIMFIELQASDYEKNTSYYYPGTFRREDAETIRVGLGEKITGLKFLLPEGYGVRTIEGRVTRKDGTPAAGAEVMLLCPQSTKPGGYAIEYTPTETRADEQGRFRLEGFSGESYWIEARGTRMSGVDDDEVEVHSPPRKIVVREGVKGVRLVLSEEGVGAGCDN